MTYDRTLSALSDGRRRTILEALHGTPCTVAELTELMPISQPAVSQHLKVLRDAGLVERESDGARRIYHLRPDGLASLRHYVESFWGDALVAFRDSFDEPTP